MTKRLHEDDLDEIVDLKLTKGCEFYNKVIDTLCTKRGLNDLLYIYPTNSHFDPHTMDQLIYFFTRYKSEGEIKIMKDEEIDPVLCNILHKFCKKLDIVKSFNTGNGDSCNIFSYIDFNYKVREGTNLDQDYAKTYSEVNHIKECGITFAEYVKNEVKKFFKEEDLRDPANLRRVILHLDAKSKFNLCLTANFIAWALLEIFFEQNGKNLKQLIEATAEENYKENIKRGEIRPGDYFEHHYKGWRTFIIL